MNDDPLRSDELNLHLPPTDLAVRERRLTVVQVVGPEELGVLVHAVQMLQLVLDRRGGAGDKVVDAARPRRLYVLQKK